MNIEQLILDLENKNIKVEIRSLGVNKYAARLQRIMFGQPVSFYGTGSEKGIALFNALRTLPRMIKKEIMNP